MYSKTVTMEWLDAPSAASDNSYKIQSHINQLSQSQNPSFACAADVSHRAPSRS
jgi:hypothetical protein